MSKSELKWSLPYIQNYYNMEDRLELKIGFYAYFTTVLRKYWQQLNTKANCWWITDNSHIYNELKKIGCEKIIFISSLFKITPLRWVQKRFFDKLNPDIWISDTTLKLINFDITSMKVLVFHSVPYKRYCFIPECLKYDLILLPGEYHRKKMCEMFNVEDVDKLQVVGWPRVDGFINNEFSNEDRNDFLQMLGLKPESKTVMYAPTWNSFGKNRLFPKSFGGDNSNSLELFCRKFSELNVNLIVRLHPVMTKLMNDKKLHKIAEKYSICWIHKKVKDNVDVCYEKFLRATDILVSDISGIITDFMVLNKPIIYVEPDSREFNWEEADLPKEFRAGRVVASLEELIEAVKISLNRPDEYKAKRQEVLKRVFYKLDGKATERATNVILERYKEFKNNK